LTPRLFDHNFNVSNPFCVHRWRYAVGLTNDNKRASKLEKPALHSIFTTRSTRCRLADSVGNLTGSNGNAVNALQDGGLK
jgi:hypothetical protein